MQEFTSLKVSANQSADLAVQLTSMSAQGWQVVSIVSTGEIVAYLSRPIDQAEPQPVTSTASSTDVAGWAVTPTPSSAPSPTPTPASYMTPTAASTTPPISSTPTAAVQNVPADWYKDPAGRFEYRYWDGTKWTENVSRAGVKYTDPPTK